MKWIVQLLINSIVLLVVAGYFPGFHIDSISAAILASVLLAMINTILKPVLIILTLPVTVLTFGFFLFVINAITLLITASLMGDAFIISNFPMAVIAAIIIALLNLLLNHFFVKPIKRRN
ncbi:MAG: phage holin family protein [Bacillaceae bacterium]|nr:phage holin family protein [Bacillaceae bacterium]